MSREEEIAKRANASLADVMENGPRFWINRQTWVVARDRAAKKMLIGGLGCLGVGEMWMDDDGTEHDGDPTYADAPEALFNTYPGIITINVVP